VRGVRRGGGHEQLSVIVRLAALGGTAPAQAGSQQQ
jgi:hypothetical protein